MDDWCAVCGEQGEVQTWWWQGHETKLCFDCWEYLIGMGDEEPGDAYDSA